MVLVLIFLALVVAMVFALNLNQERKYDITSIKGDMDGHFQALYRRLDVIDKKIAESEKALTVSLNQLQVREREIEDLRLVMSEKFEEVVDSTNDELFSVKSALQALGASKSQNKRKVKKAGKRR